MKFDQLWCSDESAGALAGVRVVDLGQYIAGPLVGTLLADQGATVIRINPPGGPRMDSPANALLHRRRRTIELDLRDPTDLRRAQALIASADVVIENFRPGVAERLGVEPVQSCARSPRLVYCSLPGFGATDPRAEQPAWEGTVLAAAGAFTTELSYSAVPGKANISDRSGPTNLPLASVFAATEGALGVAAALVARDRDGLGQWVEAPLFDALFEAIGIRAVSFERNTTPYTPFGSGVYLCADDRCVLFMAGFFRHLVWLITAIGKQEWIDDGLVDFEGLKTDPNALTELRRRLVPEFALRTGEEWEELGRVHGFPMGMLRSTSEFLETAHAVESGTLIDVDDPVLGRVRVPGSGALLHGLEPGAPAVRDSTPHDQSIVDSIDAALADSDATESAANGAAEPDGAGQLPLAGLRVLDMSRILAAPTTAKLLGQLGADVIKVDEEPESFLSASPMPFAHEHLDRGKRTIVLDLKEPKDFEVFKRLAADADVVVQNWTLGTAERLGVDWASLCAYSPDVIVAYLNANGRSGPWAGDRGYADLATLISGISAFTYGAQIPASGSWVVMHAPPWSYTDYLGGVLGAFGAVAAIYERARSGQGRLVETSLLRASAVEQLREIVEPVDADGKQLAPTVSRSEQATVNTIADVPLQRMYSTKDDSVFVSIPAERAEAVIRAFGIETPPTTESGFGEALAAALATRTSADAVQTVLQAGAGAHQAFSVEKLMEPGGLADQRGLRVEDQSPVHGRVVMPGPVIRFSRTPMRPGYLPGPFGCDREEILAGIADEDDQPDANVTTAAD